MILNKNLFELQFIDEISGQLVWVVPPQQLTGLKFSKKISDVGNITMTLPYNQTLWDIFHEDLLVDVYTLINSTNTMQKEDTYFLTGKETYYENNIPQMVFFGNSVDDLVLRRFIIPTTADNTNAGGFVTRAGQTGVLIEQLFNEQMINASNIQRNFANLTLNKTHNGIQNVGFRTRYTPLIDTLKMLTQRENINWKIRRSVQENLIVDIGILTNDFRYSEIFPQSGFLVFSPDYGNITNPTYKQSDEKSKSVVYVLGEGEGSNQQVLQLSTPDVFNSVYSFKETTAKSTKGEGKKSSAFQQALDVGLKEIFDKKREITFNFQIVEGFSGYEYRTNFDIGDWVTFFWRDANINFKILSTTFTVNNNNVQREFELELKTDE